MEEWIGSLWDRWITKAASQQHPQAAVELKEMTRPLGIVFRALGGDPGLQVQQAVAEQHGARRRWLERLAGTGTRHTPASRDGSSLRLPASIALFADPSLNRDLYLWLAALAAHHVPNEESWFVRNQRATSVVLARFPALEKRYHRLLDAALALRLPPEQLPEDEAQQETVLRAALHHPGSHLSLPPLSRRDARPLAPMPLWLAPAPEDAARPGPRQHQEGGEQQDVEHQQQKHRAEQVDNPESEHGILLYFRAESLLSWAEYVRVNRSQDDDPDPNAGAAADNLDKLSLADSGERIASRVRFDLDLPAAGEDDEIVSEGIPLPEWDYRQQILRPAHCHLHYMQAREAEPIALPDHLRPQARRLRQQFAMLAPARRWQKAQPEGLELDLDAWVRRQGEQRTGQAADMSRIYQTQVQKERDLACLVLADLSLSTDAHANNEQKVIDVIRDSLMLFAEALKETGDHFALAGFSSLKRGHIRYHALKAFEHPFDAAARGRIQAIRPGYYTRLGAAIRHATEQLARQPNRQRLLLILSDGKPHDLDLYEGRYGIEDTRQSIEAARQQGVRPFCITIDREGASYLPHVFGANGYTLLRRADELTERLPMLYAQLTKN